MECMAAVFLGMAIAAIAPDVEIAQAISPPIAIVFFLFAGVFINLDSLPNGS